MKQAGFDDDACVTADLEIYENRVAGTDAEPGVPAADRTLTVRESIQNQTLISILVKLCKQHMILGDFLSF